MAGQVSAQSEESLTVIAKGVQAEGYGASVRPKEFITFVPNALLLTVPRRITTE